MEQKQTLAICPQNHDTITLFLSVQTQWRCGPMGIIGLDYTIIPMMASSIGIELTSDIWNGIQTLERFILEIWSKNHG